jgi:hypothetical protein
MGVSSTPQELSRKLTAAGHLLETRTTREVVEKSALRIKRTAETQRNRAVGGDGRMSNVGRSRGGARLGVRYDLQGTATPTALVRATGPWQLIERATRPHRITSRYARGSRSRRSRAGQFGPVIAAREVRGDRRAVILTPWGYRRYARHPGTRGKRPWEIGVRVAMRNIGRDVQRPVADALRAVFR